MAGLAAIQDRFICCLSLSLYSVHIVTGNAPDADLGPLISPAAKKRVLDLVQSGVDEGAELLLDGRDITVPGYENGNFVGPTYLHNVKVSKLEIKLL